MGLAYLGLSSAQGAPMLTDEDVMKGEEHGDLRPSDSCQLAWNANTATMAKWPLMPDHV